jgi:RNA polymerase sigma factor (sigma-70 family)
VSEPDDVTLIERWRSGDADAGRALFQRYFESVYRFFLTKCESEAEELTQQTFLACMRAREQFRKEASFRTYLFTIARHELHHRLRRYARKEGKLDFEVSSMAQLVSSPATKLARHQEQVRLVEALRSLPVAQQTLLELHYWEELDIAELAEIFECPAATIRTRLHRARHALREVMTTAGAPAKAMETLESMDVWVRGADPTRAAEKPTP